MRLPFTLPLPSIHSITLIVSPSIPTSTKGNTMTIAKISPAQASFLRTLHTLGLPDDQRKQMKKDMFAIVRDQFGLPTDAKLSVETDPDHPNFCVLKDKRNGTTFTLDRNGRYSAAVAPARWVWFDTSDVIDLLREQEDSAYSGINCNDAFPPPGVADDVDMVHIDGRVFVRLED